MTGLPVLEDPEMHELTYSETADPALLDSLREDAFNLTEELLEKAGLREGAILIVGCSTSEVMGAAIGTDSNLAAAEALFSGIRSSCEDRGVFLAAQCCEHLNRAVIVERRAVPGVDIVNAVPQPKAGGSFAAVAYRHLEDPVAVEHIRADAGLDIGDTLIGMHLKEVAVPVRLSLKELGQAHVASARVRPKFVGGSRAVYDERLL